MKPKLKTPKLETLEDMINYNADEIEDPKRKNMAIAAANIAAVEILIHRIDKLLEIP